MNLLQISDPKQAKDKLKKFVVGIDLGTTNSLIAMRNTATKFYIENESTMIPSIVNFHPDGRIIIGKAFTARFRCDIKCTIRNYT